MESLSNKLNFKIQWILGGLVFLIALVVYGMSVAPTTSFWDCGEFIACSKTLSVMHPPGAPLYLLIGRILTMLPVFEDVGLRLNIFSVLVSAATVLLTFLIIIQLIRRWRGEPSSWEGRFIVYASAVFGSLAFAFTDSFWFNAVEAEVYAFSMFFTALVVWLALFWGERSEKAGNLLLILFIFYLFGLAADVHLLNILTLPFVMLIALFHENQTVKKLLLLIFIQGAVPIALYMLFYQFNPEKMVYPHLILQHQDKAGNFLKWFGLIWVAGTLIYMYYKDRQVFRIWWILPLLVIIAYSAYLVIYVRAGLGPPINENDPSVPQRMMDYLARKQYGTESMLLTFLHRKADFWNYQIHRMFTRYFGWQFIGKGTTLDYHDRIVEIISFKGLYGLPFIVGLWGAVHHFFKDWKRAIAVFLLFFLMGYAIVLYLNQPDPQPRERDYSYVGAFFAFALWIGIGLAGVLEWVTEALKEKNKIRQIAIPVLSLVLFAAVPLNLFAFNKRSHSRAGNFIAWDYSHNILESCESDAILFTNGDNDTFPLWYLQEVEGLRKDVRVVNLSLLNTPWYIKQLRDQEPKVSVRLNDKAIDELTFIPWETKLVGVSIPESVRKLEWEKRKKSQPGLKLEDIPQHLKFSLAPTYPQENPQGLRIQDLMIIRILEANQWKRPVYFAVTVSPEHMLGLNRFLRMVGLTYKVLPFATESSVGPAILEENILEKFQYRGLDDSNVFYNNNTVKLLQNYRVAFMELARYYLSQDQNEKASFVMDEMSRRIPARIIPYSHEGLAFRVADIYRRLDRIPEAEEQQHLVIPGSRLSPLEQALMKSYYAQFSKDWDQAETVLLEYIQDNPYDAQAYSELLRVYRLSKQYEKGISVLERWLSWNPRDAGALQELEALRKMAASSLPMESSSTEKD